MMKTGCTGTESPKNGTGGLRRVVLALAVLLLTCVLMAGAVSAADVKVATWSELKGNFTGGNNITLCNNVELEGVLTLGSGGGDLVLDLGGYTLSNNTASSATPYPIQIDGGNLTIRGSGTIEYPTDLIRLHQGTVTIESGTLVANGDGSVVTITGSDDPSAKRYSNLIVGKDAVLKGGWYVAFISYDSSGKNFGITMDISGQLISCEDPAKGGALYINGQLQEEQIIENPPVITIRNTAVIAPSKSNAVYAAGYGKWIIEGGKFEGTEALSIKSGEWIIEDGTFTGNGPFFDPAESNGNGSEPTGAAVSVTTNHAYAKKVNLTITGGTFTSKHQSAFYEGGNSENTGTALKGVAISGGSFATENDTLSAVTIHNSGNISIENGISITDAAGNNLLYRGVNLTGVADWTGDDESGYTLTIDEAGSYKLMDAFTTTGSGIQITADGVTLDGNDKKITTIEPLKGYILKVSVKDTEGAKGVTLQNLDISGDVASGTGNYGGVTVDAGKDNESVPVILKGSTIDMSDVTATNSMNPAVYFLSASGSKIVDNVIKAGSTEATGSSADGVTSRGIVIDGGSKITVSENDVTMGTGAKVSIGIQFKNGPTEVTLADNRITATNSGNEKLNRAIDITTLGQDGESYTITGTKLLAEGGASFESAVNVIVSSSAPENAELSLTTNGNDFSNVEKGIALVSWADDPNSIKLSGSINADDFPGIFSQENIIALSENLLDKVETDVDWTHDPEPSYSSSSGNMNNAYRVLFNDGATTLSVQTDLSSGDKLTKPETPVKDGYTFAGWYKDSACTQGWDFETGISGDMTLYAKWTAAGSSGETEATTAPTATSTAVTTPQPTKTQSTTATTSAPQATTAAGVSPTLTQAPAPVAGALFGLLAAGVLLRRRFQ